MRGLILLFLVFSSLSLTFKLVTGHRVIRAAPDAEKTGYYIIKLNQSLTHVEFKEAEETISRNSENSFINEVENDPIKFVTPLVTGVAAIHLQREPYLTPEQLKHKLLNESCTNILDFDDLATIHNSKQIASHHRFSR